MGEIQPLTGTEDAPSSLPTSLQFHLPMSRGQTGSILTQISGCFFLSLVLFLVMNYALPAWEICFPESLYVYDSKLEELWGDLESRKEAAVIILLVFPGRHKGWDVWMASLAQWTWVWANSGSWWRTGKPCMLQFMGSQRVRHDLVTKQQQWWTDRGNRIQPGLTPVCWHCWPMVASGLLPNSWKDAPRQQSARENS